MPYHFGSGPERPPCRGSNFALKWRLTRIASEYPIPQVLAAELTELMTNNYADDEVEFVYPENWVLTDYSAGDIKQLSVQSQQTSTWDFFSFRDLAGTEDAIRQFTESMHEQYEDFETEPITSEVGGIKLVGIEANFYCMDMLATARAYAFQRENAVWMIAFQAESREFETNCPVMEAMTVGALRETED